MSPPSKDELRRLLVARLDETVGRLNEALRGERLDALEPVLTRLGRAGRLPHWYERLRAERVLPNLDGKTIGSVIEMLLVAILEVYIFRDLELPPLSINPARGVDLPDLELGVKSPSTNYCTSEPFFSAYERLIGSDHDALVLLTDYQERKKHPPLTLTILKHRYLRGTQIADTRLCGTARAHRAWLREANEGWAKRVFRFLAYVNQSDWLAKRILALVEVLDDEAAIARSVDAAGEHFNRLNQEYERRGRPVLPNEELERLRGVLAVRPLHLGVIDAADNWVVSTLKDASRAPSETEWNMLVNGPLDGEIGMSFALQWRYNFGRIFNGVEGGEDELVDDDSTEQ